MKTMKASDAVERTVLSDVLALIASLLIDV